MAFLVALAAMTAAMQPDGRAWAIEAPSGVPSTVTGSCHIGTTWMVGSDSFFTIPSFSGTLAGGVPSSAFKCMDHTAAAPEDVDATYRGTLSGYSYEQGWVEYSVIITPPGVTDGVTRNELGLIGYQRVGGTVRLAWDFRGAIELSKRSANGSLTNGNRCYSLAGAVYGVFRTQAKAATHRADQAARTFTTDASGTWASGQDFTVGTYYVAEITPPAGYALDSTVYPVTVSAGNRTAVNAGTGFVADAPQSNPVTLWAAKRDAETPDGSAQGTATLAGTLFEICYYDGYYELETLPDSPTRRWVVASGEDGRALADDASLVSGDAWYRTASGQVTIPLGTVTVREMAAPDGYLLGDGGSDAGLPVLTRIVASGTAEVVSVYAAPTFADYVQRGGVMVGKVDRQNGGYLPQGAATLEGAAFCIVTASAQPVMVDGTLYETGRIVKTIRTERDESGRFVARTKADCLPVGYYTIYESESSEGYRYDGESQSWHQDFQIVSDGQVVDLTSPDDAVANQVKRGDFSFSKMDGQTAQRLGSVAFLVTSQTTGEAHVMVTDENGMASTATDWNAHTTRTNANDDAVAIADDGYVVDEELLDPLAGIWFGGRTDAPCDADDAWGALPYDAYTVTELSTSANSGYELVSFSVRVSRDERELDLGTIDDNAGPLVGTSLADDNGVKLMRAGEIATVTDTVNYVNLDPTRTYTVQGSMHLVTDSGEDGGVVATGSAALTPESPNGAIEVPFSVDTSDLGGQRLVAFERLVDAQGTVVATHEDLMYEGQTVRVPAIATTMSNREDGGKQADADTPVQLTDAVYYQGLTPGDTYTMAATLHVRNEDGSDGGVATDARGQAIVARQSFTADDSIGTVNVVFSFDAPNLAGTTVVAFEELMRRGESYATHADITDEGQSVQLTGTPAPPEEVTPTPTLDAPLETVSFTHKSTPLPNTGDALDVLPLLATAGAALGLGIAAFCVRNLQRGRDFTINRGPRNQ